MIRNGFEDLFLRGDGQRLKGVAVIEGIVRYRHEGGGQLHAHQIIVRCNKTTTKNIL